ncbi:RluA family pseudouridine synthase [Caviibacter abscessus]|uniref:RluA family pseudouridine synthase n=1 Tax=Caviibacter abscessus TaxID=1766719 RepID=UPI0008323193|nr:RluA family pseudouridine synthase [Caviibacter abscessus]
MKIYKLDKTTSRMKISQYLREHQSYSGRSLRMLEIYLNGKRVKTTKKLPSSGVLKVLEKEKSTNIEPIYMKLDIVYEDEDLLIVNKPYNLVTHPTLKKVDMTLANAIVYYLKTVPRFYNRLDMNTTGLIIIAKNSYAQAFLQNKGQVKKKYLALVENECNKEYIIEAKIYKDGDNLERIIDDRGQEAKTVVKPVKYFSDKNVSLVECELFTGRTHQIRVHLKHIGYPIIGDTLYNQNGIKALRQMLHAYKLSFMHPRKLETVNIEIEAYEDMIAFTNDKK